MPECLPLPDLGARVREARGEASLRELAARLDVGHTTLLRVERGDAPNVETYVKLCEWLAPTSEVEVLNRAIDRMGWPEIHAFQDELRKGQDICEDAGGFFIRAIRRLFGLAERKDPVVTYQDAARALVAKAQEEGNVASISRAERS